MSMMSVIIFLTAVLLIVAIFLFISLKQNEKLESELSVYTAASKSNTSIIATLQKQLSEESKQRVLYQQRTLELEDAIKESVGVSLRNEVTKVECFFDENEMTAMNAGLKFLIREYYASTSGVKFYIKLIEKIEKHLSIMFKSIDEKSKLPK